MCLFVCVYVCVCACVCVCVCVRLSYILRITRDREGLKGSTGTGSVVLHLVK